GWLLDVLHVTVIWPIVRHEQRQADDECRAAPDARTEYLHRTAMQFHEVPDDAQAESKAGVGTRRAAVGLAETVEDEREKTRRDAFAGIAHRQLAVRVDTFEPDLHFPAARGELHGIGEEIPDDLLQAIVIAGNVSRCGVEHALDPNLLGVRRRPDHIDRGVDDLCEIKRLNVEAKLSCVDAGEVEDVLDETALRARVAVDRLQSFSE